MAQAKNISQLKQAYKYCNHIVKTNYENFPVASFCLPKYLRNAIATIYAFARLADNYADSSQLTPADKLNALNNLETQLINIQTDLDPRLRGDDNKHANDNHPTYHSSKYPACHSRESGNLDQENNKLILLALADTIHTYELPILPFLDLLTAFKQDITKNRYYDFGEVLTYCCYSANPIGRLLLHLTKQDTIENLEYSDYICTSLQLINFMQDLYLDLTNLDRCYIPQNELNRYHVSIDALKTKQESDNIDALIKYQLDRIYTIYNKGLALGSQLNGLFGFEIRLIICGGKQILNALYARKKYYERPTLTFTNKMQMFMLSFFPNSFSNEDPLTAEK